VLAPINESEQMVELAQMFALPVLVVASTKLGTINHSLLTVEALRRRALVIAGVVMVGERDPHNREAIESYGTVSVLGEMPILAQLDSKSVRQWALSELDNQSVLVDHLRLAHHARQNFKL
jgi:dethiobiotin synthetase